MTTANPKPQQAPEQWEPYPALEREPKDMEQLPPILDILTKLCSILTPGYHYPYHPNILIGGEIPIYYGAPDPITNRTPHLIPDCLVALAVDSNAIRRRVGYDPRQVGKPPDFVIEVASPSTRLNDSTSKRDVYQQLGITEYWRLDPTGGSLYGQAVIGERLVNGQYEQFQLLEYLNGAVGSTSSVLNLNFRWKAGRFSIHNPMTGEEYEHPSRSAQRLQQEVERLREENRRLRDE